MIGFRRVRVFAGLLVVHVLATIPAAAQSVPSVMNYQGRLTDNTPGQNPINGAHVMQFAIFGSALGPDLLWTETWPSVDVVGGVFNVLLGTITPIPSSVFTTGSSRYLEVIIAGETLAPRQMLGASGWAHQAQRAAIADALGGLPDTSWQRRVAGACAAGQSIRAIDAIGNVTCEADDGITAETDPQVGALGANSVPRWNGTALVAGALVDDGSGVTSAGNLRAGSTSIGQAPGLGSSFAALWKDGAPGHTLAGDATNSFLNAPAAAGSIHFTTGNVTRMSLSGSTGDLSVSGDLLIGLTTVTSSATASTATTCTQGGSWACFTGQVTATCPSGTRLVGGGCLNGGETTGLMSYGGPGSNITYTCWVAADHSHAFTASALCARVGF